mmetsp:Transcript_36912/g.42101  ORF Transcript_36912/g.42101 Transcript_36912/m.42101 type:complete len:423 (+) Transcript_36912:96-1364(+)
MVSSLLFSPLLILIVASFTTTDAIKNVNHYYKQPKYNININSNNNNNNNVNNNILKKLLLNNNYYSNIFDLPRGGGDDSDSDNNNDNDEDASSADNTNNNTKDSNKNKKKRTKKSSSSSTSNNNTTTTTTTTAHNSNNNYNYYKKYIRTKLIPIEKELQAMLEELVSSVTKSEERNRNSTLASARLDMDIVRVSIPLHFIPKDLLAPFLYRLHDELQMLKSLAIPMHTKLEEHHKLLEDSIQLLKECLDSIQEKKTRIHNYFTSRRKIRQQMNWETKFRKDMKALEEVQEYVTEQIQSVRPTIWKEFAGLAKKVQLKANTIQNQMNTLREEREKKLRKLEEKEKEHKQPKQQQQQQIPLMTPKTTKTSTMMMDMKDVFQQQSDNSNNENKAEEANNNDEEEDNDESAAIQVEISTYTFNSQY